VKLCFDGGINDIACDYHETVDGDHGRIETRRYRITSDMDWLDRTLWENPSSIAMVRRERYADGTTSVETSYYVLKAMPTVRGHWGIENSLHRVLDIAFREDESRIRKDHAPVSFAVMGHMALNLPRQEPSSKRSIKGKRLKAGWDTDYLARILRG
jgi:predicted transposase YbfD/YdcC